MTEKEASLQKKLIPVNIAVAILSFIAAISLLFTPFISIDLGAAVIITTENMSEESEESNPYSPLFNSIGDLSLGISTVQLYNFANAEDPVSFIVDDFAAPLIARVKEKTAEILSQIVVTVSADLSDNVIDANLNGIDANAIVQRFEAIVKAKGEDVKTAINDLSKELQKQIKDKDGKQVIPDEVLESIDEYITELYDDTSAALGEGEEMTLESIMCATISKLVNEQNADEEGKIYTTYNELLKGMLKESEGSEREDDFVASINDTIKAFSPYVMIAVYVMFGFAGIWALLGLYSLLKIFLKNKRFTMWYVKLLGFIPCLLFFIVPLVAAPLATLFLEAEISAAVATYAGIISSMTWISGICYGLLWLVSVFWAYPIKSKIRREKRIYG